MVQRVQSIFLFLSTVVAGLLFLMPLGHFLGGIEHFVLTVIGLRTAAGVPGVEGGVVTVTAPMGVMAAIAVLLPLVTIFIYKKRQMQLRLCYAAMAALAGLQIMACVYLWGTWRAMQGFEPHAARLSVGTVLPIVAFVLVWMAMRAIRRDEAKVRSIDRIR